MLWWDSWTLVWMSASCLRACVCVLVLLNHLPFLCQDVCPAEDARSRGLPHNQWEHDASVVSWCSSPQIPRHPENHLGSSARLWTSDRTSARWIVSLDYAWTVWAQDTLWRSDPDSLYIMDQHLCNVCNKGGDIFAKNRIRACDLPLFLFYSM